MTDKWTDDRHLTTLKAYLEPYVTMCAEMICTMKCSMYLFIVWNIFQCFHGLLTPWCMSGNLCLPT